MSFLMGYVAGMATSSSRNSSRHNFEEERLKTKCKELEQQIERLQEQLVEANDTMCKAREFLEEKKKTTVVEDKTWCIIENYLAKWGVK